MEIYPKNLNECFFNFFSRYYKPEKERGLLPFHRISALNEAELR